MGVFALRCVSVDSGMWVRVSASVGVFPCGHVVLLMLYLVPVRVR